VNEQDICVSSW